MSIKLMFRKFGSRISNPIISFIINVVYWIYHIKDLKSTLKRKKELEKVIQNTSDVSQIQKSLRKFIWTKDKRIHWIPWVTTFIHKEFHDDCDGAAIYAKWMFKQIGVASKTYHLVSEDLKDGHLITVTKDKTVMVSNSNLVSIPENQNWKQFVLNWSWHKDKYKIIY